MAQKARIQMHEKMVIGVWKRVAEAQETRPENARERSRTFGVTGARRRSTSRKRRST